MFQSNEVLYINHPLQLIGLIATCGQCCIGGKARKCIKVIRTIQLVAKQIPVCMDTMKHHLASSTFIEPNDLLREAFTRKKRK